MSLIRPECQENASETERQKKIQFGWKKVRKNRRKRDSKSDLKTLDVVNSDLGKTDVHSRRDVFILLQIFC